MEYLMLAPFAFAIVLALVAGLGTPLRSSAPSQPAAAPPPPAAPVATGQSRQQTYPPPAPGHRYAIQNGQLVQVRV